VAAAKAAQEFEKMTKNKAKTTLFGNGKDFLSKSYEQD